MGDEVLEEREWTVEEYLAQFDPASPDHALLRQRADKLKTVTVKKVRSPGGVVFEDTVFVERSGQTYVIRSRV